jgi:succinate-acetate transporter protein
MSVLGEPRRSTVQPRMSVVGVPYRSSADLEAQPNGIRGDSDSETILLGYSPEPPKPRGFGDPAPLGLSAFALTTSVLSLINMQSRSVTDPNIAVSLGTSHENTNVAFGYGGIASFIAGMWDFALGNTFGALVFTSYGGFWISFATIYIPGFNIANASGYVDNPEEFMAAVGHYLICNSTKIR